MKEYKKISINKLNKFNIQEINGKIKLSLPHCPNKIIINHPFILDEDIASLAGLMPDGSLIKDIRRLYFTQKKNDEKHTLFQKIIHQKFRPKNKIFMKNTANCFESYINSTVLCHFLHYVLDFNKSDEPMRVPEWIFESPDSVKRAYLHEAFAMEATIGKALSEIRFITKDYTYALDIQDLLKSIGISSHVKSRIGGTNHTVQYRISVYRKENFIEFKKIGFTQPLHIKRFTDLCKKYKI